MEFAVPDFPSIDSILGLPQRPAVEEALHACRKVHLNLAFEVAKAAGLLIALQNEAGQRVDLTDTLKNAKAVEMLPGPDGPAAAGVVLSIHPRSLPQSGKLLDSLESVPGMDNADHRRARLFLVAFAFGRGFRSTQSFYVMSTGSPLGAGGLRFDMVVDAGVGGPAAGAGGPPPPPPHPVAVPEPQRGPEVPSGLLPSMSVDTVSDDDDDFDFGDDFDFDGGAPAFAWDPSFDGLDDPHPVAPVLPVPLEGQPMWHGVPVPPMFALQAAFEPLFGGAMPPPPPPPGDVVFPARI